MARKQEKGSKPVFNARAKTDPENDFMITIGDRYIGHAIPPPLSGYSLPFPLRQLPADNRLFKILKHMFTQRHPAGQFPQAA